MQTNTPFDWRTIGALNTVSALAQVGQFGIAFVVLPVWLAQQGLDASQLGLFAASLWAGQLPGLGLAPRLCLRWGPRAVVVAGLLCTLLALAWIAMVPWPYTLAGGALAGFGLGLRWIGLEPWLYRIAPDHARGRLVGFHETLIALAPIVAPVLAGYAGLSGPAVFWIGGGFVLAALLPLAWARAPIQGPAEPIAIAIASALPLRLRDSWQDSLFKQGVVIALFGGMMEAAVSGLFAPFAQGHGLAVGQTAHFLALFGVGGLLMQYGVGWLADHRGVATAAGFCAVGTALVAGALALPLTYLQLGLGVFLLGGFITCFLTLALIASTKTSADNMARNVSLISMVYTASAVLGPMVAGPAMEAGSTNALMGFTACAALVMAGALAWGKWRN
jgi:MFS family permease